MTEIMDSVKPNDTTGATPAETGMVHVTFEDGPIAILRLGTEDESPLTLTEARLESLDAAITALCSRSDLRGVIVTGPAPRMFAAGADINAFATLTDAASAEAAARRGQTLFGRFAEIKAPVVCAIEGPCLGGGLELALGCDLRVASDDGSTKIGLPEVKLGILPGFGGTQRLTRLIGLPGALDLILKGSTLDARRAQRKGVVDRAVPSQRLLDAAREEIDKLATAGRKAPRRRLRGLARWASVLPPLRALVASKVRKTLQEGQARFYPAPRAALECCLDAFRLSPAKGFAREARALGELMVSETSRSLVHLFFLTERSKKLGKHVDARTTERALVVGGGAMGAGIAGLMASRGTAVRLCDLDGGALAKAKGRLHKSLDRRVKRRRMKRHEAQAALDRMAVSAEWGNLARTDLFLEAVTENLELKRKLFTQAIENGLTDDAIIATNTSSLSVDAMAEGLPHPERIIGLHFFNPPEKMPLVEVVRGKHSSEAAVATGCKLALALGKFPVVVGDAPGFLVNRCLGPYMFEAARMMVDGIEPEELDAALLEFGMPMGPARLMDEVGFDVLAHVAAGASGDDPRTQASPLFAAIAESGALGQKTGGGLYDGSGKEPGPARATLRALRASGGGDRRGASKVEILERLVYPMIDEAYRCLDAGVVASEEDLDLGLVMGIGFPPFTGGPARYTAKVGAAHIVERLLALEKQHGARFAPGDGLRRLATDHARS